MEVIALQRVVPQNYTLTPKKSSVFYFDRKLIFRAGFCNNIGFLEVPQEKCAVLEPPFGKGLGFFLGFGFRPSSVVNVELFVFRHDNFGVPGLDKSVF